MLQCTKLFGVSFHSKTTFERTTLQISLEVVMLLCSYPRVCLTNQVCSHGAPLEGLDNLPGVDFSNKAQCRLKYGASSYYCVSLCYGQQ